MVAPINEFIDQVRQLLGDVAVHDDENEPGQCNDEGDVVFSYETASRDQRSTHAMDSQLYQQILKSQDCQLLEVYNSNALYIASNEEKKAKVMTHMKRTKAYAFVEKLHGKNPMCVRRHLDTIVQQVTTLLDELLASHCINDSQFRQMSMKRSEVRMDYLFYLPDVRQKDVPFQPIMVCDLGPTIGIARYLSRLLQPIYDRVASSTTFCKETEAVYAMETYAKNGLLRPTTLFATVRIHDACTIVPHAGMMQAFERFLHKYYKSNQYRHGMSTDTIIRLTRVILDNQLFVFQNQINRQIKGAASQSPLSILLMNIYLFYWQADLVHSLTVQNELFGRCFDQVFLTWNGSRSQLRSLLHATIDRPRSSPIKITTSIAKKVNYMDADIEHTNGYLQTKINHDMDTKPRALPHVSGHPRQLYSTLIRATLIRAVLCCSNVMSFQWELHDVQETFRTNGYTAKYINARIEQFFREFDVLELQSSLIDQSTYDQFRHRMFEYEQEEITMQIQRRKDEQDKDKWYISSPFRGQAFIDFQAAFQRIWNDYFAGRSEVEHVRTEVIEQSTYPPNTK